MKHPEPICSKCGQRCFINSVFDVADRQELWCYCKDCDLDSFYKIKTMTTKMHKIDVFEKAIESAGYRMNNVKLNKNGYVCRVIGLVPAKDPGKWRQVHWDANGNCFDRQKAIRMRIFDLQLPK